VRGVILPEIQPFYTTGGRLSVEGGEQYEMVFPADNNNFVIPNVVLDNGRNRLQALSNLNGDYQPGASVFTEVTVQAASAATQATAGIARSADGRVLRGAEARISVDGTEVAVVYADGCGYYHAEGLPLGTISVEVIP